MGRERVSRVAPVRCAGCPQVETEHFLPAEVVDVGKHLRPSYRRGRVVLYVQRAGEETTPRWSALKLP